MTGYDQSVSLEKDGYRSSDVLILTGAVLVSHCFINQFVFRCMPDFRFKKGDSP